MTGIVYLPTFPLTHVVFIGMVIHQLRTLFKGNMPKHTAKDTDNWCLCSTSAKIPPGFKQVPGYIGYAINRQGIVISKRYTRGKSWKKLKPYVDKDGYKSVVLSTNNASGKQKILLHRLMLMVWKGPPPSSSHLGLHNDGDVTNNNIKNLRWGTHIDNTLDTLKHEAYCCGESSHMSKLNNESVAEVRRRHAAGESCRSLGKVFGVTTRTISLVVKRLTWKHVY